MAKLNSYYAKLFEDNKDKLLHPTLNGVTTIALEQEDDDGEHYFAIPIMEEKNWVFTQICGTLFLNHFITRIDYDTYNGRQVLIKAYF